MASLLETLLPAPTPQQIGPDSIARMRKIADALLERGTDFSPIQSWTQGAARVANAMAGAYGDYRANEQEQAGLAADKASRDAMFGSFLGGNTSTPAASTTQTSDAGAPMNGSPGTVAPLPVPQGDLPKAAFDYFTGKGYTPAAAAGLVGNITQESSFAPDVIAGQRMGDKGTSGYLGQWHADRLTNFLNFAKAQGKPPSDFQTQLDFYNHELETSEARTKELLQGVSDPVKATAIAAGFERPYGWRMGGDPTQIAQWSKRAGYAQDAFNRFGTAPPAVAAAPTPDATASIPQPPVDPRAAGQVASLNPAIGMPAPSPQAAAPMPGPQGQPVPGGGASLSPQDMAMLTQRFNPPAAPAAAQSPLVPPGIGGAPQLPAASPPVAAPQMPQTGTPGVVAALANRGGVLPPDQMGVASMGGQQKVADALINRNSPPPAPAAPQVPQAAAAANPSQLRAAMEAMSNPWASEATKQMASMVLQREMQSRDPMRILQMQKLMQDMQGGTPDQIRMRKLQIAKEQQELTDPKTQTVGNTVYDVRAGKPVFQAPQNPMSVSEGQTVVDPNTGKPIYQAPAKAVSVTPGDTLVNPMTGEPVYKGTGFKPGDVSELRKEMQGLPSYKSYTAALPAWNSMVDAVGRDSAASDLNLVYGIAKVMDPNSVVREGEVQMANDTQGVAGQLNGMINSINGGNRLQAPARQALMAEAASRMQGFKTSMDADLKGYSGIVQRRGMNLDDVLPQLPDLAPYAAPQQQEQDPPNSTVPPLAPPAPLPQAAPRAPIKGDLVSPPGGPNAAGAVLPPPQPAMPVAPQQATPEAPQLSQPPLPGARLAPNKVWYVPNPAAKDDPSQPQWFPVVNSPAEAMKLPSGSRFAMPDGRVGKVP